MTTRYDIDRTGLADLLDGMPRYRVDQVWRGLYERLDDPADWTDLPKALRADLGELLPPALTEVTRRETDGGDTVKVLWALGDGTLVESVVMHYDDRSTVCISSQAGCAMGCGFCATGQAGFSRHLTVGEIVEQVVAAMRIARPRRLSNIVFMGMGEPLANTDAVIASLDRIVGDLGIGARHVTVSTVGLVPGIRRLAAYDRQVGLAISLHAATDELRDELVPINTRYPIRELSRAAREWIDAHGRRLSFEWAMIDGVNDTPEQAAALADVAIPLRAHVNLIPLNRTPEYPTQGSTPEAIRRFREDLESRGVNVTVRRTRGNDIDAACGQLAAVGRRSRPVAAPTRQTGGR